MTAPHVDFIGLNFWPRSRRYVPPSVAAELVLGCPDEVCRVGLFVDPTEDEVHDVLSTLSLDLLQFHGTESPDFCRRFAVPAMKAFRLRDRTTVDGIGAYLDGPDSHFLVDAWVPGVVGGSGEPARLDLARLAADRYDARMFLAGGLSPETVGAAIDAVRPWAVDVASGVELEPGIKCAERVEAFRRAVEAAS